MAVLPIRLHPDPVLRERAPEVERIDNSVRKLIVDMVDTMIDAPGQGLAAPQVGVLKRVIVYVTDGELKVLVNPEILEQSGELLEEEACLSIPGLAYPVARAERLVVRGLDETGSATSYEARDLHARVIQHEIDHLDGILFIERLEPELRKQARRELRELILQGPGASSQPASVI